MKKLLYSLLLCFSLLSAMSFAQITTIVNYDFNSGTSDAALTPSLATNISSVFSSTEGWIAYSGVASAASAFTTNSTAGNSRGMANSSGTNTKYFLVQLGGTALPNYSSFKIYLQAQRSSSGAQLITLSYSTDGTSWTDFGTTFTVPTSFGEKVFDLSSVTAINTPSSLFLKLSTSGASGAGTVRIDNLQIQGTAATSNSTSSDIIALSGYSYPTDIDYKSYQAADILNDGNSLEIAKFTIRDGGATSDADALATTMTSISLNVTNSSNIRRLAIYDGATEIAEAAGSSTVSFNSITLSAADNSTKDFSIRATFNSTVTDNQNILLTVANTAASIAGSSFGTSNAGGAATDNTGNNNKLIVTADRLSYITNKPPAAVAVGTSFPVYVKAIDANGSTDLDAIHSVTLSRADGAGILSSAAGLTQNLALGVYSWTDVQYNTAEAFTIQAAALGLTSATSPSITASPVLSANDVMITNYSPQFNTASDEYIVLFNNTNSQIDLNGYEIAYSSSSGSVPSAKITWTSSTIIPAKKYRLLATSPTISVGTVVNKTADETYTSFASTTGQVAFRLTNGGNVIFALATGTISGGNFKFDLTTSCATTGTGGYYLTGEGGLYSRSGDNNIDYTYIAATNISDIPNSGTPALPVELSGFSGFIKGQEVQLVWSTATEVNNMGFDVERNAGGSWEKIGFVKGNGNSYSSKGYSFTDKSPLPGKVQYRLKQIDTDGKYKYYDEITVNVDAPKDFKLMQNSPNPFNPSTAIKFQLPVNTFVTIKVYDQIGREVATLVNQEQSAGSHIVYWNGRDNNGQMVSSGMYLYRISAGNFAETRKMNLLK